MARYRAEGDQGLHPRSRRPHSSPSRLAAETEDEIVGLRKELAGQGLDAASQTIAWHLAQRRDQVPSVATIWRVLRRRGLVTPQPQKRPRSSYVRFCADLPSERWQMDITHWQLAGGASIEILSIIDDHSRFMIASAARPACKAGDVVTGFRQAAELHGLPASVLAGLAENSETLGEPYTRHLGGEVRELRFHLLARQPRIAHWLAPGRPMILPTVFRKTRNFEQAR